MKKILKLGGLMVAFSMVCSCSDIKFGDDFLGTAPELNETTLDTMFNSRFYSEQVLTKAYTYLPYGLPTGSGEANKLGMNILESLTDLNSSYRDNSQDGPSKLYYNGVLSAYHGSPGNEAYRYGGESDWKAIRYAWFYIQNIDRVPDMSAAEKAERVAEAKMILAISYAEMLRYIGGFPYLDHAIDPNDDMTFPRLTFAESVDKICGLIDEAIPHLEWVQDGNNDGRMNRAGAYALKLRVQLFAASPLFNSNEKWHPQADDYTCYGNYDVKRWEAARATAEKLLSEIRSQGHYELIQPESQDHRARRLAYRKAYYQRGGTEVLISIRKGADASIHNAFMSLPFLYWGPTLNYVDMFPWADGEEFDSKNFNWGNPDRQPFFDASGEPTRDPRLYETCAVPGDIFHNGELAPLWPEAPRFQGNGTGFRMMKFVLQQNDDRQSCRPQWPYIRLAEVYLMYAEILNHLEGPSINARAYINKVRHRVGLGDLPATNNKEKFLEQILRERALEFGYEEVRWFDLVRYNRQQDFQKDLYGLHSEGDNPVRPTSYTFEKFKLGGVHERYWASRWDSKWYLAPIPATEVNKGYGMTQNPGW